jgi:hypothetical protein
MVARLPKATQTTPGSELRATVLGMHGPLTEVAPGLWQVEADLPGLPFGRRMVIARREDGDLVVHNAIMCDDATMAQIEGLGAVRWLIVPGGYHRMDLPTWTVRYPNCSVIARAAATPRIRERGRVDGGPERLPADLHLEYVPLDGVPTEGVMIHRGATTTLVFNDLVQNHPARLPGVVGMILGLIGSTGGAKVTGVARRFIVGDKRALAAHLRRLATPEVALIVPGHGQLIREHAADVLGSIADTLHRG